MNKKSKSSKQCPFCGEEILEVAIKCKHCGSIVGDTAPDTTVMKAFSPDYEILEEIGRGGMATVYRARQKNLDRIVALKIIPKQFAHDKDFLARFHHEAISAGKLVHPNVIHIYDEGEIEGYPFIAMEYLAGGTLQDRIRERGHLAFAEIKEIILPILDALSYAHEQGFIHRDVKSSNIMFDNRGRSILVDFGIARSVEGTKLTKTGTIIGTPEYMSPEQIREDVNIDNRSDVYSAGAVLYEMATGQPPFQAATALGVLHRVVNESPTNPKEINRDVSSNLQNVILKALSKDPNERYQNCVELSRALSSSKTQKVGRKKKRKIKEESESKTGKITMKVADRKRHLGLKIAMTIVGIGVIVTGIFALKPLFYKKVEVPHVIGHQFDEAEKILKAKGLIAQKGKEEETDIEVTGTVARQYPVTDSLVREKTVVVLDVYKKIVHIPTIQGLPKTEVLNTLHELGVIDITQQERFHQTIDSGRVIGLEGDQERLYQGDAVTLLISLGAEMVDFGNFVGQKYSDVETKLTEKGLRVRMGQRVRTQESKTGVIANQTPKTEKVPIGSEIILDVYQKFVSVPMVIGESEDEAKQKLQKSGLIVGSVQHIYHDTVAKGVVLSIQDNPSELSEGSRVILFVSAGKEMVYLPDMKGMLFSLAQERLTELKFAIGEVKEVESFYDKPNIVVRTIPEAGNQPIGVSVEFEISVEMIKVPNLANWDETEAANELTRFGLQIGNRFDEFSENLAEGKVIRIKQSGERLPKNSPIDIVISKGDMLRQMNVKLIRIPGGDFLMGDQFDQGDNNEKPIHLVTIDDFYLSETEITVEQFCRFLNEHPDGKMEINSWLQMTNEPRFIEPKGGSFVPVLPQYRKYPVIYVTWYGAESFCKWVGGRLPTEAEWEYAARNGGKRYQYPFGDQITHNDANYLGTGGNDRFQEEVAPVKTFIPNDFKLFDMAGNLSEWCADWFDADYYKTGESIRNPKGPKIGLLKVIRGGSWDDKDSFLRCSHRECRSPNKGYSTVGFRLCKD